MQVSSRELNLFLTYEHAIYDQRYSNEHWYQSGYPDSAEDFRGCCRHIPSTNYALHQNKKQKRDADAREARYHSGLDFVVPLYFGSDSLLPLHLHLAAYCLFARHEHVGEPGVTPIELLLRIPRINDLPDGK